MAMDILNWLNIKKINAIVDIINDILHNTIWNGGISVDIAGLSMALAQTKVMNDVSTAMLAKSMDTTEAISESMIQMMEQSVTPNLGTNIDIRL